MNSCWFLLKWSLLGAAIAVVFAIPQLSRRVDREIRSRVEAQLAQHYDNLRVTIHSAEIVAGRGILVRGLSVIEPEAEGPRAELAHIDEVFIRCNTAWDKLIQGEPEITQVVLRRPTVRATRRPDGSWSAEKLLHARHKKAVVPEVQIEGGVIEVFDPLKDPSSTLTFREVNVGIVADCDPLAPIGEIRAIRFQGTLNGDLLRHVELTGTFEPPASTWTVAGAVEGLELSPELYHALPEEWSGRLGSIASLRGQGGFDFHVAYDPSLVQPCQFHCAGRLTQGRFEDPRLPRPLTDVEATVVCANDGVRIERLAARSGTATLLFSGHKNGYDAQSPMFLGGRIQELELDQELVNILPAKLREQWAKYLPAGEVNANVRLSYDGGVWQPELSIECLNVSFTYDKFPYRLEHGHGGVGLKNGVFTANLTGYSGSQPVRVTAEMLDALSSPYGWVEAKGANLPIDEKLLSALQGKSQAVIRSMEPRGTVDFEVRAWRDRPGEPFHRRTLVGLNRCTMRYEKFPYPISNIRGTLEMNDGDWRFRDLEGFNHSGHLSGNGELVATPEGNRLRLSIDGEAVALENELRDALKPGMQQVWNNVQPQGIVDLHADIVYLSSRDQLSVDLRAEPRSENASIQPHYFPYRLEKLHGTLVYRDGRVTIERFRGEHGNTRTSATGRCDFFGDGTWRLQLEDVIVERLRLDRELAAALPGRLKKALTELSPNGPIHLRGSFGLAQGGGPQDALTTQWDLLVGFQQASLDIGVKLENLHGEMRLTGACDADRFYSRGELALDSAMYKDYQVTQITGPFWIDEQRVLFGTTVDRPLPGPTSPPSADPQRPPRSITGQLFGGKLSCDGWVFLGPTPRYKLQADLAQADLARCVREAGSGSHDLRGTVHAVVDLHGSGRTLNLLGGHGKIQLSEADIYELPLMMSILKRLRTQRPDRSAFSDSDIDFRVEGNNIYFDRIKFSGDTVSLVGNGEMDFESQIRLSLHAMVGRGERNLPIVHDLLGGVSQQIMLIHVGGTLQSPETSTEPFPGIARALQQFQPDREENSPRRLPHK